VIAVTERPIVAAIVVHGPDGSVAASSHERRGVGPFFWYAEVAEAASGTHRAGLGNGPEVHACDEFRVSDERRRVRERTDDVVWPVEWSWERDTEALYSAWVEKLFDDPLEAQPSWNGLSAVLGDPARNLLHDHLGLGEDSGRQRLVLEPDCADLPFFLRAYFAWKVGLPFGFSNCTRGGRFGAPRCSQWHTNLDPPREPGDDLELMRRFLKRDVGWAIHSGSARTPADDDRTDLYLTKVAPASIRPGAVYADPYGHTLVVVRHVAQTSESAGVLLAVDAQPDGTVARKRFWRGNFLFALDPALGGPGFKRFRPIVFERRALRALGNREVERSAEYGDFGLDQHAGGVEGFYDAMDDLQNPTPLDPARALREVIQALDEQLRTRVRSVENGRVHVAENPAVIRMPDGAEIFETTGAWEDFSTPARDLRILVAIDVVRAFPARVERRRERFAMPAGKTPAQVRAELEALLVSETAERRFSYTRTDGSDWTLSIADVFARAAQLEIAYDPNDCVEVRWGAAQGSDEAATCTRRAPAQQQARMEEYRAWFRERRRPPRE